MTTRQSVPGPPDDQPAFVLDARGRRKVLRPLPRPERALAVERGLAAYGRGDFYLAHEEWEPAWMGARDPDERERLAGFIKLAAAFVHASRGNPAGTATNLRGARERLWAAVSTPASAGDADATRKEASGGFDLPALIDAIDELLARVASLSPEPVAAPGALPDPPHDVAGPAGRARRPPLALDPPAIARRTSA